MPILYCKKDHLLIELVDSKCKKEIGVYDKRGNIQHMPYYGALGMGSLAGILGKRVRLDVVAYCADHLAPKINLSKNEFVVGHLTPSMTIYCVLNEQGLPQIVNMDKK